MRGRCTAFELTSLLSKKMKYILCCFTLLLTWGCNSPSLKSDPLKDSKSSADSIKNYRSKVYDGMGGTFKDIYLHDSLISHNWYDSIGILRYTTPIDISKISKTKIKFLSGRNYFDKIKIDTLEILNDNLPFNNRGVSMSGSQLIFIKENFYKIKALRDITQTPKKLKLYVHIYDQLEDSIRHLPIILDSTIIPVK